MRFLFSQLFMFLIQYPVSAQLTVHGTVFDISKVNYVENVRVVSTGGMIAFSDSLGRYHIMVTEKDSISFIYLNKPTQQFAVGDITDPGHFDISLRVPVKGKYSMLKEVTVYAKTYRADSLENRNAYADIYDYRKPRIETSVSPTGGVGMDIAELVNMFRFRRNKRMKAFQQRLEAEEQEKYVNYRFSKPYVRRVTGLQSPELDSFVVWYRPDYEFTRAADEIQFNEYILNALYHFQKITSNSPGRKPED